MKIYEYLRNEKEQMPKWLADFQPGNKIKGEDIFCGRVLFYPGAFDDGQPLKNANIGHYCHIHFYVDYQMRKAELLKKLKKENAFAGYKLLGIQNILKKELCPNGWVPHVKATPKYNEYFGSGEPYCVIAVFERKDEFDEDYGCKRFALVYLYADAIATFDAVFANYSRSPDLLVLQDHGFGGNYDKFGKDGLMHEIAKKTKTFPKYILCAENTSVWDGYELVAYRDKVNEKEKKLFENIEFVDAYGNKHKNDGYINRTLDPGFHGVKRYLYKKK